MPVHEMTLDELTSTMRRSAGQDDGVDLDAGVIDITFEELGYDSVALLETCARVEQELGIRLADSTIAEAKTPRALLAVINEQLAAGQPS